MTRAQTLTPYKKYLQFVTDQDGPLIALQDPLTYAILVDVPVRNQKLIDLLGTRYLLQPADVVAPPPWRKVFEDPDPRAFDALTGGVKELGPYVIYENPDVFPRAFVAPHARPLPPEPEILAALKGADFHTTVFLAGYVPSADVAATDLAAPPRDAVITLYQANQVRVQVEEGTPGYLVLTDVWFPGWSCTVNGQPTKTYRADYVFRAAAVPAEACEVVFTFAPPSFRWGGWVSAGTAGLVAITLCVGWLRGVRKRHRRRHAPRDGSSRGA